ncbi:MAG TPA: hypothetical protein VE567_00490, partial [Sphingomonas sp.]|nr:hypothetical protein [Sphingomonas sp.]
MQPHLPPQADAQLSHFGRLAILFMTGACQARRLALPVKLNENWEGRSIIVRVIGIGAAMLLTAAAPVQPSPNSYGDTL